MLTTRQRGDVLVPPIPYVQQETSPDPAAFSTVEMSPTEEFTHSTSPGKDLPGAKGCCTDKFIKAKVL